ncbi:CAP domain-containing protein [Rhexocercosporidium sp. MPI-PUGE-AT-0058]|nr:CAP domain-containing protein [Rhexocercosporidium sp. MPI-PUGE-AT-0058]
MRSSTLLALFGATVAIASPVHQALHKKAYVTDIVTEVVTVTVTAGDLPSTSSVPDTTVVVKHTVYASNTPKTTAKPAATTPPPPPPPPPAPTTTSTPAPVAPSPEPVVEAPAPVVVPAPAPKTEATQPAAAPAAPQGSDYQSTCLRHHDLHRANHTAAGLTWDPTLAGYAETIAKSCVFAHDMTQGGGGYGQNLAAYGSTADIDSIDLATVAADAITNQWYYGEAANMPYGQDSPAISGVPEYLHFSQVLWKSTTKVGCATVKCGGGTIFSYQSLYTVCNYAKTGNVIGSFASEVTEPIGLAGITATIS